MYPPGFLVNGKRSKFDKVSGEGIFMGFAVGIDRNSWKVADCGVFSIACDAKIGVFGGVCIGFCKNFLGFKFKMNFCENLGFIRSF